MRFVFLFVLLFCLTLAAPVRSENDEIKALKEENKRLKEENQRLQKDIRWHKENVLMEIDALIDNQESAQILARYAQKATLLNSLGRFAEAEKAVLRGLGRSVDWESVDTRRGKLQRLEYILLTSTLCETFLAQKRPAEVLKRLDIAERELKPTAIPEEWKRLRELAKQP